MKPAEFDRLWQMLAPLLPKEIGCSSGMTCWRRLRGWQNAGVWDRLHAILLDRLNGSHAFDWEHLCIDSSLVASSREPTERAESDG